MSNQAPKATAAALDMCVDFGIDPATIPNPEKVVLTQPMVQAHKDALAAANKLPAADKRPVITFAKAIDATAAALDMCVDFGIDPAAIPNPEKVTLTQPMVQAYKDALPEASGEASGEAPVIALRPEWASDDRPAIQAYAKALGIPANGRTETLVAAIESAIEAGTARLLTAEELDKYADPASAGGEEA